MLVDFFKLSNSEPEFLITEIDFFPLENVVQVPPPSYSLGINTL